MEIHRFGNSISSFVDNLRALRSFVSSIEPILNEKLQNTYKDQSKNLIPLMLALSEFDVEFSLDDDVKRKLKNMINDNFEVSVEKEDDDNISFTINADNERRVMESLKEIKLIKNQVSLLYQSSLISLIVSLELLVGKLIQYFLKQHPKAMGLENKSLSFDEIRTIGSFEEAENHLIEKEVQSIMYGGFKSWYKYIQEKLKLKTTYLDKLIEEIHEVFSRRNLFVHNDGIVNSIYFSLVSEKYREGMQLGKKIELTKEYLSRSINIFEKFGTLLALELWLKIDKSSTERGGFADTLAFEYLLSENWEMAASISKFKMLDDKLPERSKLMGKVNYWQAKKWMGEFDKVKQDVMKEDFSAKSREFQLCLLALQDNADKFFDLLPMACPSEIRGNSLKNWPIFREMRKDNRYDEFLVSIGEQVIVSPEVVNEVALTTEFLNDEETAKTGLDSKSKRKIKLKRNIFGN